MRVTTIAALLLTVSAAVASAQTTQAVEPARRPYRALLAVGLGGGVTRYGADLNGIDNQSGGLLSLKIAGAVSPGLLIGGEVDGWRKYENGVANSTANIMLMVYAYPKAKSDGLFGGFGFGIFAYTSDGYGHQVTVTPGALELSLGYNASLSPHSVLTPFWNLIATGRAPIQLDASNTGGEGAFVQTQFGLGITFH